MKIFGLCFYVCFLICCQSPVIKNEDAKPEIFNWGWEPNDNLKKAIGEKSKELFPDQKVYGISVIRLRSETILNIYPVRGNDFIRDNGKPSAFYESGEMLYLIYCGLESLNSTDSLYIGDVQRKLDSTCSKHGIKYNPNMTYDESQLFLKVQNDSLTAYETGGTKEFYMIFNGLKEEKAAFTPPVIK